MIIGTYSMNTVESTVYQVGPFTFNVETRKGGNPADFRTFETVDGNPEQATEWAKKACIIWSE